MKDKKTISVVLVISFFCITFALILSRCYSKTNRAPVGFIDGIRFMMSPSDAERILGAPQNIEDRMDTFSDKQYKYQIVLKETPADLYLVFHKDKELLSVSCRLHADTSAKADSLFEWVLERILSEYEHKKGFFCEELEKESESQYKQKLGVRQGPGGIYWTISVDGLDVTVRGYDQE